jgi:type I restriction enzyme S subunit
LRRAALPSLNGRQLRSIPVRIPRDINEQKAIAAALRDADAEIAASVRRLEAARAIKEGMMQELLTGRTRLVPTEAPA